MIKIDEAGEWVATMCQKMNEAHEGEVRAISTKAEIANLKKKYQVEIKDLKEEADSKIQWF